MEGYTVIRLYAVIRLYVRGYTLYGYTKGCVDGGWGQYVNQPRRGGMEWWIGGS